LKKAHIYAIPAIGAALIAVLAQISMPIGPVPFTLQNFAIGLIATVFRPREAVLSVGLYLLLGAIGLPVFANGGAGFHVLVGPSAGYLWFDLVYAGLASYLIHTNSGVLRIFFANLLGDSLVFVGGILSLHFLAGMPFDTALKCCIQKTKLGAKQKKQIGEGQWRQEERVSAHGLSQRLTWAWKSWESEKTAITCCARACRP